MNSFPEITRLKQYFEDFAIAVERLPGDAGNDAFWVNLSIDAQSWEIYVDDEYKDFREDKPILAFYLTLCALDDEMP